MDDKFVQSILKTGLFDIGDNDDRLKWLQQSVADLQKKLEEDHSLLPKYTLVALDPNISDKEPILNETELIVTTYWKALRGKYPEMPRNILRCVILNSLNNVGVDDPIAARVIYLTAVNFFPYAKLNNEKDLVEEMLTKLGEIAEKNAMEEWSLIEEKPSLKIGTLKVNDFKFGNIELNKEQLKTSLKAAINNDPQGYGSSHGGNTSWGEHFANKSSEAISTVFKTALETFNKSLSPSALETPINKFFAEFKKNLDANLKTSFASLIAVERRSKLLWWKETLYSPSLKRSYRGLDKNVLPIIMGVDLNNQVPEITPISADYLLRDTLFLLNDKKDDLIKFTDYLTAISENTLKSILKRYFTTLNEIEGRISITDFIALLLNDRVNITSFFSKTGIKEDEHISLSDLSVSILHDLLTQRLVSK
jgi:GTPase-associated system helical domain